MRLQWKCCNVFIFFLFFFSSARISILFVCWTKSKVKYNRNESRKLKGSNRFWLVSIFKSSCWNSSIQIGALWQKARLACFFHSQYVYNTQIKWKRELYTTNRIRCVLFIKNEYSNWGLKTGERHTHDPNRDRKSKKKKQIFQKEHEPYLSHQHHHRDCHRFISFNFVCTHWKTSKVNQLNSRQ